MTLALLFFGLFVGRQNVHIYDVPTPADPAVKSRFSLCLNASAEGGVGRSNDTRASIEQFLAPSPRLRFINSGQSFLSLVQSKDTFMGCSRRDREKYLAINRGRI